MGVGDRSKERSPIQVDKHLKNKFKLWCVKKDVPMSVAIENFMVECIRGKRKK